MIKNINPKIKIFNTYYKINNLKNFDLKKRYLIFSGIGNPDNFKNILIKHNFDILDVIIYPDHYEYTEEDILKIKKKASDMNAKIITTEKDFVKIPTDNRNDINFLDVNLEIIEEKDLLMLLKSKMYE